LVLFAPGASPDSRGEIITSADTQLSNWIRYVLG